MKKRGPLVETADGKTITHAEARRRSDEKKRAQRAAQLERAAKKPVDEKKLAEYQRRHGLP